MSVFPQKRASAQKPKSRRGTLLSAFQPHSETFTCLVLKSVFPTHTDLPAPTQQPPQTICSECQSWQAPESSPLIFQTDALRRHHRAVGPQPPLTESHTTRRLPASLFLHGIHWLDGQGSFGKGEQWSSGRHSFYSGVTELPPPLLPPAPPSSSPSWSSFLLGAQQESSGLAPLSSDL